MFYLVLHYFINVLFSAFWYCQILYMHDNPNLIFFTQIYNKLFINHQKHF